MALFVFLCLTRIVGKILELSLDCGTMYFAWTIREVAG